MNRSNALMLGILALLGLVFFATTRVEKSKEATDKVNKSVFSGLKVADIDSVTVEKLKESGTPKMSMEQRDHLWYSDSPTPEVLSNSMFGSSLRSLVDLQKGDGLSESPAPNPVEFGLDKPAYRITLKSHDGASRELMVGDMTPDGNGYYVRTPDNKIVNVPKSFADLLDASPSRFREQSALPVDPSKVNRIVLAPANGKTLDISLTKPREKTPDTDLGDDIQITDLSEEWQLTKPEVAKADPQKVRDYLAALKNVHAQRFLGPNEKVDFSKPTVSMQIYLDGKAKPYRVDIGPAVPIKPNLYYVRRYEPEETMVVQFADEKVLEPTALSFEQRHFALFEVPDVTSFDATIEGNRFEANHDGSAWTITQPPNAISNKTVQLGAGNDFMLDIKAMEYSEKVAAPAQWKDRADVKVFGKSGKSIVHLMVGPLLPDNTSTYIKVEGDPQVYRMATDPIPKWEALMKRVATITVTPSPNATPVRAAPSPGVTPMRVNVANPSGPTH